MRITRTHVRTLVVLLSLVLLTSFGLHSIQINHEHQGIHTAGALEHQNEHAAESTQLDEYMHVTDKKLAVLLVLMSVSLWLFLYIPRKIMEQYLACAKRSAQVVEREYSAEDLIHNYLWVYLRIGVLHPKMY